LKQARIVCVRAFQNTDRSRNPVNANQTNEAACLRRLRQPTLVHPPKQPFIFAAKHITIDKKCQATRVRTSPAAAARWCGAIAWRSRSLSPTFQSARANRNRSSSRRSRLGSVASAAAQRRPSLQYRLQYRPAGPGCSQIRSMAYSSQNMSTVRSVTSCSASLAMWASRALSRSASTIAIAPAGANIGSR